MRAVTRHSLVPPGCLALGLALASGCAPHDEDPLPAPIPQVAMPPIIQEVEPAPRELPIVAPELPELAPARPLAHLAPRWKRIAGDAPPPRTVLAVGESAIAIDPVEAAALGIQGIPADLDALGSQTLWPLRWAGPLVLLTDSMTYRAVEPPAGVAWVTGSMATASYTHLVSPRTLVAAFYEAQADRVIAWALHDGHEVWQHGGSSQAEFTRIKKLWADEGRGFLLGDRGLWVFDPVTGATLWQAKVASAECGVASGDGVVVIEDPAGHRILDARTGEPTASLAGSGQRCGWEAYYGAGVSPAAIAEGRLLAFDSVSPSATTSSPLRAFDLATRQELWRAEGIDDDLVVADHDAVYVARSGGEILVALDAQTGKQQAEISIGAPFGVSVEPVGGEAGPLLVIHDDTAGQWILERAERAPAPESFVIEGRLVPVDGLDRKSLVGVRIRVGDQVVKTDKRGRFSARGSAIGVIPVRRDADVYEYSDDPFYDFSRLMIDGRYVELQGQGNYDLGDIPAWPLPVE